jgi:N utilization substance protein B
VTTKNSPWRLDERRRCRGFVLQMLYQWEVGRENLEQVEQNFWRIQESGTLESHRRFAGELLHGTVASLDRVDPLIVATTENWRLSRMAVIDRLILRLAVHEMLDRPETPRPVVINEAIELARTYSTEQSAAFINGILDGVKKHMESPTMSSA